MVAGLLVAAPMCRAAGTDSVVSGFVRDTQGVAQMGALVQVLNAVDAAPIGSAYTDLSGHYSVAHLLPGRYQIRATAALFLPAMRGNLRLPAGGRALVDLTLSTMFQPTGWLPAERRRTDEPADEWKWTLRSAANRPILRLVEDDGDGGMVMVSSSATEASKPVQHASASVTSGDGGFGTGGVHHRLAVDEVMEDGSHLVLRGDVGADLSQPGRAPSSNFDAGFERRMGFAGSARVVASVQTRPEMRSTGGTAGLQAMRLASAQRTRLGDVVDMEYGSSVSVIRVGGVGFAARPFVRVTVHPVEGWTASYRMATSRELQAYSALDSVQDDTPVATMVRGRLGLEQGTHQELGVAREDGRGSVQVAFYRDAIGSAALAGVGVIGTEDMRRPGVQGLLVDTTTDSFRLLSGAYQGQGVRITVSEPLTPTLAAAFTVASGEALSTRASGAVTLAEASESMRPRAGQTATIAVKGRIVHTGTKVRAAYRWQPRSMVTAVDPYGAFSDQAFLSFYLAQPLRLGGMLPAGLSAVVDVTNLLSQGYQQVLSKDGRPVFLAQSPRALQAGLSYTF